MLLILPHAPFSREHLPPAAALRHLLTLMEAGARLLLSFVTEDEVYTGPSPSVAT